MTAYEDQLAELKAFGAAQDAPQGSAQWLHARVGKVTASRFKSVIAKLKSGKPAKERDDYLWELVVERLTGRAADHYASTAMQWGTDNENAARMAYEARSGELVEQVGFLLHPKIDGVGGSPDGLVGDDGGWEGKCPWNSAIHLQTILGGMPEDHMAQVQGLMWIKGRKWWDFTSYDPRLPEPFNLYVQRIPRDDSYIAMLDGEISAFKADVDAMYKAIQERAGSVIEIPAAAL